MILGDPDMATAPASPGRSRVTIDDVFARLAQRRPDALALVDAPNRSDFTGGAPRRVTYAETDRIVTAIARRLRAMDLPTDAVVGVQLPNIVEGVLAVLAILRAGMIVAPLPLLWRHADIVAALTRVSAKALVTCGRVGNFDSARSALGAAADAFSIRYVCGFGDGLPDGVVPFDDLFAAQETDGQPVFAREETENAPAHVAAVTFDVTANGIVAVPRSHPELMAGGLAVVLESHLAQDANILSTIAPSSFGGISMTLLPWLLSGGTLVLHHPFDAGIFVSQQWEEVCRTLVVPATVGFELAARGAFAGESRIGVIAAWRAPELLAMSLPWRDTDGTLIDVALFGETGLIAARRGSDGRPSPVPFGPVLTPRGSTGGIAVAELLESDAGTLALRGPMVPRHPFPPGIERSGFPYFRVGPDGSADTGYACRADSRTAGVTLTAAPAGIVSIGGSRLPLQALREAIERIDARATLTVLPDPLLGHRLIGNAAAREAMRSALESVGVNPLIASAFCDRVGADLDTSAT